MAIKILHLYPKEMNLYSDIGNLYCLIYRLKHMGYSVEVMNSNVGDKIKDFDIMLIGGGQDKEMGILKRDMLRKADALKYYIENEKTVLAICGGYQMLGEYFKTGDNKTIEMTGVLPFYTVCDNNRCVGNMVYKTSFGKVVGFENHSGKTYISKGLKPLGKIITGCGNNGKDKTEGLIYKNTFCTYAHGPVLPKNINFANEIICRTLKIENPINIDDKIENICHNNLISRFS